VTLLPFTDAELAELNAALQVVHIERERLRPPVLNAMGVEAPAKR